MYHDLATVFTGRHVTILETVDSTNSYLSSLLSQEQVPEGSVILARKQTGGRGQSEERWLSEPGKNLLLSFAFYPVDVSIQNLFILSKVFSLGVYDFVKKILKLEARIKWPNDIYIGDKKLCGMLIENAIRNPHLNHTILGIGLNVNQLNFPAQLPNPVSLRMILGKELDLDDCFCSLCNALENRYLQLNAGLYDDIHDDYVTALYRLGEMHSFENNNKIFKAKITAVTNDGKILLRHDSGLIEQYDFKELKFIL
jgi:BirA family biotin operon repressor/biotin-[acetyl-CoA-carboxylase] ligase